MVEKFKGNSSCQLSQGCVKNRPLTSLSSVCPAEDFTFSRLPRVQTHLMSKKHSPLCSVAESLLAFIKTNRATQIVDMMSPFLLSCCTFSPDRYCPKLNMSTVCARALSRGLPCHRQCVEEVPWPMVTHSLCASGSAKGKQWYTISGRITGLQSLQEIVMFTEYVKPTGEKIATI